MPLFKLLKALLRSRSLRFARDFVLPGSLQTQDELASIAWTSGDGLEVFYRPGTTDTGLIYDILLRPGSSAEYRFPAGMSPGTILDIGANIGIAARQLAFRFPDAVIHAFEPVPENFNILKMNVRRLPNVVPHLYGLGAADRELKMQIGGDNRANKGGYSMFAKARGATAVSVQVRGVRTALTELAIRAVDIIKIDTEGAEFEILSALPDEILRTVQWICGELHTEHIDEPTDFKALELLSRRFDVQVSKPMFKRNYPFAALRKDLRGQVAAPSQ